MKRLLQSVIALAALALPVAAQSVYCESGSCSVSERIYRDGKYYVQEIRGALPSRGRLSAETDAGWIKIIGGRQEGKVSFKVNKRVKAGSEEQAKRYFEAIRFKGYTQANTTVLRGEPSSAGHNAMLEMEIETPRSIEYTVARTRGGSVDISGLSGKAVAESFGGWIKLYDIGGTAVGSTMGGSIDADKIGGDAKLESAGGSITIGAVSGNVTAETAGGSVSVGQVKGNVRVETAGGSIGVKQCSGALSAATAGGSIEVGDVGSWAKLETAGGSIRLTGAKDSVKAMTSGGSIRLSRLTRGVIAETMAGGIEAEIVADRGDFMESKLVTNAGDIVVYLPSDLAVTVRAVIEVANGHRIVSEFNDVKVTSDASGYGPRTVYGNGQLNGGGPMLKLNTSNGNIYLKRLARR